MSEADKTHIPNPAPLSTKSDSSPRRTFLGHIAGLGAAAAIVRTGTSAARAASPDAELIALCTDYQRHRALVRRMDNHVGVHTDEEVDTACDAMRDTLAALSDMPATTREGIRSKATAMLTAFEYTVPTSIGGTVEDHAERHEWLAYRLAQDVLAMGGRS